jgi:hypothetical protein
LIFFGEGDIAPTTVEILRQAERAPDNDQWSTEAELSIE